MYVCNIQKPSSSSSSSLQMNSALCTPLSSFACAAAAAVGMMHRQKEELTWVSRFQPFSNMGLMGRSVSLDTSTSLSLDRPSRLMNPPLQYWTMCFQLLSAIKLNEPTVKVTLDNARVPSRLMNPPLQCHSWCCPSCESHGGLSCWSELECHHTH